MPYQKFGEYYLFKKISEQSGMAEVFLAKHVSIEGFEKFMAIKRILPHLSEDEEFVQMFISEAKLAAQLNHQNIVQIYDFGKVDEVYYIAMEYVPGRNLKKIWERLGRTSMLPLRACLQIMSAACKGLDYAHRKEDFHGSPLHIVHRDVSPQNVIVSYEGEIKVIDFGIAKAAMCSSATRTGILKGKVSYMSPEQASGRQIDCRSDIFACGIVLYELVTGTKLFKGESELETLRLVQRAEISPPSKLRPDMPKAVEGLILKALARDPAQRYQTAAQMEAALEEVLHSSACPPDGTSLSSLIKKLYREEISRELQEMTTFTVLEQPAKPKIKVVHHAMAKDSAPRKKLEWMGLAVLVAALLAGVLYTTHKPKPKRRVLPPPIVKPAVPAVVPKPEIPPPPAPKPPAAGVVTLNCSQSEANIFLDDEPTDKTTRTEEPVSLDNLTPDVLHAVRLTKDGYKDWSKTFKLNPGENKTLDAVMEALSGKLFIDTAPAGAAIYINGKLTSGQLTPGHLTLAPQRDCRIRLSKAGFKDWETTINLDAEQTLILPRVDMVRQTGILHLITMPQNAQIFINGKQMGQTTPADIEGLLPGEYSLMLSRQYYEPYSTRFTIRPDKITNLSSIQLKPLQGALSINSVPWSEVYLDGKKLGVTPLGNLSAPAGEHRLRLVNPPGEIDYEEKVVIEPQKLTARTIKLEGNLSVNIDPAAEVYVDGHKVGTTPLEKATVLAGIHQLRLYNASMNKEKLLQIKIKPNDNLNISETW